MHIRLLTTLGILCASVPLRAQWAVVDIDAIAQLTHQVSQMAQQIQIAQSQYNQLKAMAQRVKNLASYRGPQTMFEMAKYADQYATLARWTTCETTGDNCDPLMLDDASVLAKTNTFVKDANSGLYASTTALYSTQQVMDGNNLAAMQAVGAIRKAKARYTAAIQALDNDAQEDDDDDQAQLAVEQRTSNSAIIQNRLTNDMLTVLSAELDQSIAQTKLQRDRIVADANARVDYQQSYVDSQPLYSGLGRSWTEWQVYR